MKTFVTLPQIDKIAKKIKKQVSQIPEVGIILGSGLGHLADSVQESQVIDATYLPGWPQSTIQGHAGKLVFGILENKQVMVLQGRVHYYEGYSMDRVTLPVRVMQRLGVKTLIVTNAAGAINPKYAPGDLMLITDHISMIAMAGLNPLRGPNLDELGPRFPDMSQPYSRELGVLAREISKEFKLGMKEGVYVCLAGPSFESPADLRFLRGIGADAVGMSTVPEVITARHGGTRVVGISGISNKANLDGNTVTTHEEVLEAGNLIVPKLEKLICELLKRS
ncbi:MAG: purine-nucleoside phosphorylase [Anaerolinea sp.]|nr:purine-nucleoside phosphorylase [Anaerolinea sp.]